MCVCVQAVNSFSAFISNFQFLFCYMVVISVPVTGCHEVSLYLVLGFLHLLYVDQLIFVAFCRSWVFMICEFDIFSSHFFLLSN